MSRRPSPGGLPLSGHLALRHAEAEMLHDQDETLDLLAQAACPDEGPRHQRRRVAGLTLQRPSNMLRFARRLRLGQPPLRHECFRKKSIRRGFADGRCRPNAFTTVETSSNDGATTCINARLGDTRCSIGMRPIFRQVGKNRRRIQNPVSVASHATVSMQHTCRASALPVYCSTGARCPPCRPRPMTDW